MQFLTEYRKRWQIWQNLLLPTHRKLSIGYEMVYLHLTLAHSKGQCHANFDWISRKWWQIEQILLLLTHRKLPIGFRIVYLTIYILPILISSVSVICNSIAKKLIKLSCCILPYVSVYAAFSCSFCLSSAVDPFRVDVVLCKFSVYIISFHW